MTSNRDDRLRRLGQLGQDARSMSRGYRSVSRTRRVVLWLLGAGLATGIGIGVASAGDDDEDDARPVSTVEVEDADDDD